MYACKTSTVGGGLEIVLDARQELCVCMHVYVCKESVHAGGLQ